MFRELIDKLKVKKKQLQNHRTDNIVIETEPIEEASNLEITVSSEKNIYKIEIDDYISIGDYIKKKKSSDEYRILDLLCNYVLWNSDKQKVNKGTYYVIIIDNHIYNILFTDEINFFKKTYTLVLKSSEKILKVSEKLFLIVSYLIL